MIDDRAQVGDRPAVSIIMPAYQAAAYIAEALDSVSAQTFSDYETIVVNDGSPDTAELEAALGPYRSRIVYLKQENRGPAGARNTAIRRARGEYVALLDSDDLWLPNYLERQMAALQEDRSLDLIYADALLVGNSPLAGRTFMDVNPSSGEVSFESLLEWKCTILTSCTVARRQALLDAGLFDENFRHAEDFDLWLRMAHAGGRISYQSLVLAYRYLHTDSLAADDIRLLEGEIRVYQKLLSTLSLAPSLQQLISTQMDQRSHELALEQGRQEFLAGHYAEAQVSLERAHELRPGRKLGTSLFALRLAPGLMRSLYRVRRYVNSRTKKDQVMTRREMIERLGKTAPTVSTPRWNTDRITS